MKLKKALEKSKALLEQVERPPWTVCCLFSSNMKTNYGLFGDQVCLGEDFVSLEDAREGVAWLVDQLGGKVKWEE